MHPIIRQHLQAHRFFKLICGASYRNAEFVYTLARLFVEAGAHVIDVGAKPELVAAVQQAIVDGCRAVNRADKPAIMVSVGVNQDVHFLRVEKKHETCENHGYCANACPHEVFVGSEIRLGNCLGCDHCVVACPTGTLSLVPRDPLADMPELLGACQRAGATALEIHTGNGQREEIARLWQQLASLQAGWDLVAFSMGSHGQIPSEVRHLAYDVIELAGSDIIIQADGKPISGRKGENSTLPCLELAHALLADPIAAFVQVSGGTNNLTGKLAQSKQIPIHGIGMGSFARKYIDLKPSEGHNYTHWEIYQQRARELVQSVSGK